MRTLRLTRAGKISNVWTAFSRLIAVACVVALVFVSFGHTLHHHEANAASATHQLDGDNDAGNDDQKSAGFVDFCCSGAVLLSSADIGKLFDVELKSAHVSTAAPVLRSHAPSADNPPPIA